MKNAMEIDTGKAVSDSINEAAKILWQSYIKGFNKFYFLMGSISILLILNGIFGFNSPTVSLLNSEYHLHLHLSLIIGIGILLAIIYVWFINGKAKKGYFQDADDLSIKHEGIESTNYVLTDKSITKNTQLTEYMVYWELIIKKELIGDFIVLHLSESPLNALMIDCEFLDIVKKEELNSFLDEKLNR